MANILLVDDDDAFRTMLCAVLKRAGHSVVEIPNGTSAWAKFQAQPADLVIMDLIMPEKEGLETIRQFRRNGARVKILAMSGGGRVDASNLLAVAQQFGADAVLAKPFSMDELDLAMSRLLPPSAKS
jgi:DNA-binding response OmpR family regulator